MTSTDVEIPHVIAKGIHRLEEIGKKGKLSKFVKLTIEHFEFLK
jgi:hypothetical protein